MFNAGGKGVNVAGCLADYGLNTSATGLLGRDDAAAFDALFADKHIEDRFVRVAGRPRINVKLVDRARGETTDVNLVSAPVSAEAVRALEERIAELAAPGRWFVLAGSLPAGVDAAFYRRVTRALHARGARVALDTSGAPLAAALAEGAADDLPDLIKPNEAELAAVLDVRFADRDALVQAACALVARGIEYVVVSRGAHGALGVTRDRAAGDGAGSGGVVCSGWQAEPLRVPVASTVGAGDALVAGLVASLVEGRPWPETGRRATAFAAGKLARVGPHLPDHAALDALAAQVGLSTFSVTAPARRAIPHQAV
jgi:1-phosphofructokinase